MEIFFEVQKNLNSKVLKLMTINSMEYLLQAVISNSRKITFNVRENSYLYLLPIMIEIFFLMHLAYTNEVNGASRLQVGCQRRIHHTSWSSRQTRCIRKNGGNENSDYSGDQCETVGKQQKSKSFF